MLYFFIYLVGVVAAYFATRAVFYDLVGKGSYTVVDRIVCMVVSLLSFLTVGTALFMLGIGKLVDYPWKPSKKANW